MGRSRFCTNLAGSHLGKRMSNSSTRGVSTPALVHSKIFWPNSVERASSGYLVGWNIRSFIACVVTVVPLVKVCAIALIFTSFLFFVQLDELEKIVHSLSEDPQVKKTGIIPSPVILGEWISHGGTHAHERDELQVKLNESMSLYKFSFLY